MDNRVSIISWLGLPESFGAVLLALALILTLAPYFAGIDFGIFRVPQFSAPHRRKLKWMGPIALLVACLLFVPLIRIAEPTPTFEFSIESPRENEAIPLGESQRWMVEGKFSLIDINQVLTSNPEFTVDVYRMPNRNSIPQDGKSRISTNKKEWHFDSARFQGPGEYEIFVNANMGSNSEFDSIAVNCLKKEEAYEQAIINDRVSRGASKLVLADPEKVDLPQLKSQLNQMQQRFFKIYRKDITAAENIVLKRLDLLDPVLPLFPNDFELQNIRAYTLKDYALVMRKLDNSAEFDRALRESEKMFEAIRQQQPTDEGAWNGLGNIAILRQEPEAALLYIDKALEINPKYSSALHDRKIALRMLEAQKNRR